MCTQTATFAYRAGRYAPRPCRHDTHSSRHPGTEGADQNLQNGMHAKSDLAAVPAYILFLETSPTKAQHVSMYATNALEEVGE